MSRLKDIPELNRDGSNLQAVMQAVRESLQTFRGYRGDPDDKALTRRDAMSVGLLNPDGSVAVGSGSVGPAGPAGPAGADGGAIVPDPTAPPTATGLTVTAGIGYLYIGCDNASYTQGHGHDRTVVYGAKWPTGGTVPTFSSAVELMTFQGTIASYATDPLERWCIWIKWKSNDGYLSTSAGGGTNGVQATTGQTPGAMIAAFGSAWIDNAMVANMSASKLTVGSGIVGGNLQSVSYTAGYSGWLVTPAGFAEFQDCVVRGTVYAAAGLIGGNTIDSTGIESPGYTVGSYGWRINSSGILRAFSGAGNNVIDMGATGVQPLIKYGTTFYVLADGTAVFSGALSAASGTFAGSLSAATGTFAGALLAATGTFGGSLQAGVLDLSSFSGVTTNYYAGGPYTVTVPAGKTQMRVTLIGGGGAGGGSFYTGGGGGGLTIGTYTVTPGTNYTLNVGFGATGLRSAGGATTITGIASAGGGAGGVGSGGSASGGSGTTAGASTSSGTGGNAGGNYGYGGYGADGGLYGGGGANVVPGSRNGYGANGKAIIEFSDPNSVVIRSDYNTLLSALSRQGIATV